MISAPISLSSLGGHGLNGRGGAHGHIHGRVDVSVRRFQHAKARARLRASLCHLEGEFRHCFASFRNVSISALNAAKVLPCGFDRNFIVTFWVGWESFSTAPQRAMGSPGGVIPVAHVLHDGMANGFQLHANLVFAPGLQLNVQKRDAIPCGKGFPGQQGFFRAGRSLRHGAYGAVFVQQKIFTDSVLCNIRAVDDSQVFPPHRVGA